MFLRTAVAVVAAGAFLGVHAAVDGITVSRVIFVCVGVFTIAMLERWRPVASFLLPAILLVAAYDIHGFFVPRFFPRTVYVGELRDWELAWFGIATPAGEITPAAWFQTHTLPLLDLLCGLAYLGFYPIFLLLAAWWRFGRRRADAQLVTWAMLWLHLAGYVAHLAFPAPAPWYVDHYGVGPAVLTAPGEASGAARFDELVGIPWFSNSYPNAVNIFGACPSLHVGLTFLAVLFAFRFRSLRVVAVTYWALVTLASVYLNHHYIVDGLTGMVFAAGVYSLVAMKLNRPADRLPGNTDQVLEKAG
ncbi:phosphatase PAP2 family protein [Herbidospora mongoliensis]|uniref:phosphatase PAP2 family protein n=1 Tax=Herbidospora mongoliensis TaxID=688067 RepID=UPI000830EAAB|nr:phosphatase PAP2 family protein [Herbidospora mongoliensis]